MTRPVARIVPIPYPGDSSALFSAMANMPGAVFLDSGRPELQLGRFDILAARPWLVFETVAATTRVFKAGGLLEESNEDPLLLLRRYMSRMPVEDHPSWPFAGGLIGYLGYELAGRWMRVAVDGLDAGMPDLWLGYYDWAFVVDHQLQAACLVGAGYDPETFAQWDRLLALAESGKGEANATGSFVVRGEPVCSLDWKDYRQRFDRVQRYIHDGDCYQVNLTRRFQVAAEGDPWAAYLRWRGQNPAVYAAFLNLPCGVVLSGSPECLLEVRRDQVISRPIKGTRPVIGDPESDARQVKMLRGSEKDRAENLMIVDLVRNDLGKVCAVGSVRVGALFAIETLPTVHHLVSEVRGRMDSGGDFFSLLRACFPGGSVTGAPKLRAMQVIAELEPHRRSVYCGSILSISGQHLLANIPIRTMLYRGGSLFYWSGGGIVADSRGDDEYAESEHKALAFRRLLESLRAAPDQGVSSAGRRG